MKKAYFYFRDRYDMQLRSKTSKPVPPLPTTTTTFHAPLDTQQFGVSLQFIKEHNGGEVIPPILKQCIEYLSQPEGMCAVVYFI